MRKAKFDHAWKKCREPDNSSLWIQHIDIFETENINAIPITSLLGALIGPNGAGKTGFLKNLGALLSGTTSSVSRPQLKAVHGKFRGQDFSIVSGGITPTVPLASEFIDVSLDVHNIMNYVINQSDFDDALGQYGLGPVKGAELPLYRHVCRRNYTQINIAEIDGPVEPNINSETEDEKIYPFFNVEIQGIQYDSRSMGFGELCAFYIIWKTCRAPKGSILLLDEPDSHLSPASRRGLFDVLAYLASQRELWILFTSHTVETLHAMQECEMYLIYSEGAGMVTRIAPVATKRSVIRALGLDPLRRLLIVVEDVDAEEVVHQILNRWGNDFASSVDVQIVKGGASEVVRFAKLFPESAKICRVVPVLDGDKKDQFGEQGNILFLPTDKDPVEAARQSISTNCDHFAFLLGVDSGRLQQSLINISHINHHDFCSDLLAELDLEGVCVSHVRAALMKAWLNTEFIALAAEELADNLLVQVDSISLSS